MRGRSIIQDTSGQSICALCAYRLGQIRRPSHIQRRFLQWSRSLQEAPSEAAAVHDSSADDPPRAPWNRASGNGWGTSGSWSGQDSDQGASSPLRRVLAERRVNGRVGESRAEDSLLPHERRARELMLGRQQTGGAKASSSNTGQEPDWVRQRLSRLDVRRAGGAGQKAMRDDTQFKGQRRLDLRQQSFPEGGERGQAPRSDSVGPRITYGLGAGRGGDSSIRNVRNTVTGDDDTWGHLRRRETNNQVEADSKFDGRFSAGRTAREEQARSGRYTPLSTRPFARSQEDQRWTRSQSEDDVEQLQSTPRDNSGRTSNDSIDSSPTMQRVAAAVPDKDAVATFKPMFSGASNPIERQTSARAFERNSTPLPFSVTGEDIASRNTRWPAEEENSSRDGGRQKKARKRRGRDDEGEEEYQGVGRSRERDRARRREQFVRTPEEEEEAAKLAEEKLARQLEKAAQKAARKAAPVPIFLPEFITVANLAVALRVKYEELANQMEDMGFEEFHHDLILDSENSAIVAIEYHFDPIFERNEDEELKVRPPPEDTSLLPPRPPVVTIMGHVDHGKTTLLDWLRKSSVAANEHGGITQHIGAFSVPMASGKTITFLDTPGHAAFELMRARGANVTDIVVLVVAADDSVKPQTIEAIKHAKAAKVPIIVAINKIDKEDTNIEQVKSDLARHGVEIEDYGGDTQVVLVSGKTGQGMEDLEEAAITLSEILDMRAENDGPVEGWVLEASIQAVGKVATVLVRRGTIRPGDVVVAGNTWARVRVLRNEAGLEVEEAGPGTPVVVDGWREQPLAGDEVLQARDEAKAKSVVDFRLEKEERESLAKDMVVINSLRKEDRARHIIEKAAADAARAARRAGEAVVKAERVEKVAPSGPKEVCFIVKGDVSGSVEAVLGSLAAIGTKEVEATVLRSGVGQVSEFDIEHAAAANGHVINFNTQVEPHIARMAELAKVKIFDHKIIYALVDDVKMELSKLLPPIITQKVLGEAEIAQIFNINIKGRKQKPFAGCKVRNGTVARNSKVRVLRKGEKIFDGALSSLKSHKRDAESISKGNECGLGFSDEWIDFQVGDQIQAYEEKSEKRYL